MSAVFVAVRETVCRCAERLPRRMRATARMGRAESRAIGSWCLRTARRECAEKSLDLDRNRWHRISGLHLALRLPATRHRYRDLSIAPGPTAGESVDKPGGGAHSTPWIGSGSWHQPLGPPRLGSFGVRFGIERSLACLLRRIRRASSGVDFRIYLPRCSTTTPPVRKGGDRQPDCTPCPLFRHDLVVVAAGNAEPADFPSGAIRPVLRTPVRSGSSAAAVHSG